MTTELAGEPDFRGPATLEVDGRVFEVDVDLRGRSQPIDGIFRWYGRVRPHAELRDLLGERGNKTGFLSTETGSAAVTVGDIDFWGATASRVRAHRRIHWKPSSTSIIRRTS